MPREVGAVPILDREAALLVQGGTIGDTLRRLRQEHDERQSFGCARRFCPYSGSCAGEHDDCPCVRGLSE